MRQVIVHAAILVCALVGAYVAWTAEPEDPAKAEVTILDIESDDLEEVRYHAASLDVRLLPREDEHGKYVWVEVERRKEKQVPAETTSSKSAEEAASDGGAADEAPEGGTAAAGAADAKQGGTSGEEAHDDEAANTTTVEVTERASFKGNDAAEKIVAAAAPMRARRKLDATEGIDPAELGFDDTPARLVVVAGGNEHTFELGDTVYGGDNRYLRDTSTGEVYLVDARVLRPLMSPKTSLLDRKLFRGTLADWDRVVVDGPDGKTTLVQHHRSDRDAAYFSIGEEGERSDAAEAWLKKFLRLRVRTYLDEAPELGGRSPSLSVVLEGEDGPERVEIYRLEGEGEDPKAGGAKEIYVARSDHTRTWVELYAPQARDVLEDLPALVGQASGGGGDAAASAEEAD
ncbi:MAG: DUF4340 domain-containing protein [Deltaproteobacteria bacterium]|nr:MAG: DUF4340 domain-containing protein [Deltaproteobacteria bacterium]